MTYTGPLIIAKYSQRLDLILFLVITHYIKLYKDPITHICIKYLFIYLFSFPSLTLIKVFITYMT